MGSKADARSRLSVRDLLSASEAAGLQLSLVAGEPGLDRSIEHTRVQRPGLAFTGYTRYLRYGRVQVVGGGEIGYLKTLSAAERRRALGWLGRRRLSCLVVTKGRRIPRELSALAEQRELPLLSTALSSTPFVKHLTAFLDERLAPHVSLHAVLVDVFGLGILLTGESGIGKSEAALDLVDRGHRLVADDVVDVTRVGDRLLGAPPELTRSHLELRGLGLLNLENLYGPAAVRPFQRVELVVRMERWNPRREYDRLGLGGRRRRILGLAVPELTMPVAPGRSTALLVEVAARNQLLKLRGVDAAQLFADRVDRGQPGLDAGARVSLGARRRRGGSGR